MPEFKAPFRDWDREDDWLSWPKPFMWPNYINVMHVSMEREKMLAYKIYC